MREKNNVKQSLTMKLINWLISNTISFKPTKFDCFCLQGMRFSLSMDAQLLDWLTLKPLEYLKKPKLAPFKSLWAGGKPRNKKFNLVEISSARTLPDTLQASRSLYFHSVISEKWRKSKIFSRKVRSDPWLGDTLLPWEHLKNRIKFFWIKPNNVKQ